MSGQEILPPEQRDSRGRFQPGNKGWPESPGREPGEPNRYNKQIKDMLREALENAGGVDYLTMQAILNPGAFLSLIGKTLPLKLTGDENAPVHFVVTKRIVIHAHASGEND